MFAAVYVAREQQHTARRTQHEYDADDRFLHIGPDSFGPRKQQRAAERCRQRGDLHGCALRLESKLVRDEHAASGDLRDCQVDEHDAARQNLHA